jgi:hypothetical protein
MRFPASFLSLLVFGEGGRERSERTGGDKRKHDPTPGAFARRTLPFQGRDKEINR